MPIEVASHSEDVDDPPPLANGTGPSVTAVIAQPLDIPPQGRKRARRRFRTAPPVGDPGAFSPRAWRPEIQLPNALSDPPYRRWWSAQLVALFGVWTQNTAAQLVILSITSSAFLIGAINIVSAIPLLLLSLVGGVLADKADRRQILMFTQSGIALLSVAWALLILSGGIAYWQILVLAALGGTIASFDLPAGQSFLAQIVRRENMPEAIALGSASVNATRSIGPLVGGLVIGAFGTAVAFLTHSLALMVFVMAIFSLGAMIPKRTPSASGERGLTALRLGLAHIRHSDELLGLVGTTALFSFFAVPGLLVLLPLFVTNTLGGGDAWVPITTSVFGLGSFTAAIIMFRGGKTELLAGRRLRVTAFVLAAGLVWLAISPSPLIAMLGVFSCGCAFETGLVQVQTRLQQLAPDDMRGRVLSVNGLAFNGVMPASTLTISAASTAFGIPVMLCVCAAALAAGSFALWRRFTWKAFVPVPA
jgi:MFS family permease